MTRAARCPWRSAQSAESAAIPKCPGTAVVQAGQNKQQCVVVVVFGVDYPHRCPLNRLKRSGLWDSHRTCALEQRTYCKHTTAVLIMTAVMFRRQINCPIITTIITNTSYYFFSLIWRFKVKIKVLLLLLTWLSGGTFGRSSGSEAAQCWH